MSVPLPLHVAKFYAGSSPVHAGLPIVFSPKTRVENLVGVCAGCHRPLRPDHFRGEVRRVLTRVAEVRAVGFCPECRLVTPFWLRVYDDLSVLTMLNGRWVRYLSTPERQSFWMRAFTAPLTFLRWVTSRR